jgi:hypothetical protein
MPLSIFSPTELVVDSGDERKIVSVIPRVVYSVQVQEPGKDESGAE